MVSVSSLSLMATGLMTLVAGFRHKDGRSSYFANLEGVAGCEIPGAPHKNQAALGLPYGTDKCGQCIKVTNKANGKSVVAKVVDKCAGCGTHNLNLNANAFNKISNTDVGSTDIKWKFVWCKLHKV